MKKIASSNLFVFLVQICAICTILEFLHFHHRLAGRSDDKAMITAVVVGAELDPVLFVSGAGQKMAGQACRSQKPLRGPIQRPLNKPPSLNS